MDKKLTTSTPYTVPIDSLKVILTTVNTPTYVNQSKTAYLSAYQLMHDAVAKGVYEGVIPVPATGAVNPLIRKALVAQQAVWTSSLSSSYFWNDKKYMILKDWAQLYRLAERRDSAVAILNFAATQLSDPSDLVGIDRWKCINNAEISYLENPLPIDSLLKKYPCKYANPEDEEPIGPPSPNEPLSVQQFEKKDVLLIYPNPTNDLITIELRVADSKEIITSVVIIDLQGKTIATIQTNSGKMTFNTMSLPAGIYAVKVATDKGSYSQTVNVIH